MAPRVLAMGVLSLAPLSASLRTSPVAPEPSNGTWITKDKFDRYRIPEGMPAGAELAWDGRRWTPNGWIIARQGEQRAFFDLHIPKTAGSSWAVDVKEVMMPGDGYHSKESSFDSPGEIREGDAKVVLLRDPVMHVYSQYLECKYAGGGLSTLPAEDKPKFDSFSAWLRHFDQGHMTYDMNCYHPYNMQTRALTTCGSEEGCHHYNGQEPSVAEAVEAVNNIFFVGLTEHYQASLCLFFSKVHVGTPLPDFCDCTDPEMWNSFQFSHVVQEGVPQHSRDDLTKEDLELIAQLTKTDQVVYDGALKRFQREAQYVEANRGTKILCTELVAKEA